ncbi:hypothetical protein HID58_052167 [Brassica napus]|uniref:Uncharacterized protein n=1 Tax=Brassica napus TaxID=3708 RepID=A0ABQ8ABG7_BRANA|nr:hypothetical protein HID58_052167 [Brassica napus]
MLLSSSPPPSTLSAFVGLLKFVVGRLLSYRDPRNINKNGEFMGITLLLLEEKMIGLKLEDGQRFDHLLALANTNLEPPMLLAKNTVSSNKTPDVDFQSILPAATVSYTVHVPRRAEEVDEAMPSFENEEKRHVSDCFKSIKQSSPLSLCVNEITIFVCFFLLSTLVVFNYLQTISHQEKSYLLHGIDVKQCNKETN